MKSVTVMDRTYNIAVMKFGEGRLAFKEGSSAAEANCAMVAQCLNNAGTHIPIIQADGSVLPGPRAEGDSVTKWTAQDVSNLPCGDGQTLVLECLEISGMRATKGEAAAAQTTSQ